jgi:hypothetical protein
MRNFYVSFITLLISLSGVAQERCGATGYFNKMVQEHPSLQQNLQQVGQFTQTYLRNHPVFESSANQPDAATRIVIPVVVHVVYNRNEENISDDQIRSQIESLNADFSRTNADFSRVPQAFAAVAADCGIRFVLAKSDPEGRPTNGITRKKSSRQFWTDDDKVKMESEGGTAAWDSRNYLNFWVCNTPGGLLGYGSFPGGPAERDGVVIRWNVFGTRGSLVAPFNLGRTATHEVGHWMNLRHIWGDVSCGDDEVRDTPRQKTHNRGIPTFPRINADCNNGPNGDMFMNFMDFSDDASLNMFTAGQRDRMLSLFATDGARNSLVRSTGIAEPWNTTAAVSPANTKVASELSLYPNPSTNSMVTLTSNSESRIAGQSWSVFTADGRMMMSGIIGQERQQLDVSKLQAGIYFVKVGNGKMMGKLVRN